MTTPDRRLSIVRFLTLGALAFLILLSYEFARPATESLFLEAQGADRLPIVWILVALTVTATVAGYSRLLASQEILSLFGKVAAVSGALLGVLLLARRAEVPYVHYALYVWKDIYIVLLVETFYCYTNAVYPIKTARWIYGVFGAIASTGAMLGGLAVGPLAQAYGTANTLWFVIPVNAVMALVCVPFSRYAGRRRPADEGGGPIDFLSAARVIRKSKYLLLLVCLIAAVQIVVNLVDYEFNQVVALAYPHTDERTAVMGQVYAAVNTSTFVLHALTGPVLRLLGVPAVLLIVPVLLGAGVIGFLVRPGFATAAVLKVMSKCFDYTIFRAAKEMLYIPLSYDEKTQGKSVVDVMTYRVAKGGASALVLGLQHVALVAMVTPLILSLIVVWLLLTVVVARRFRSSVSRAEEMGHHSHE